MSIDSTQFRVVLSAIERDPTLLTLLRGMKWDDVCEDLISETLSIASATSAPPVWLVRELLLSGRRVNDSIDDLGMPYVPLSRIISGEYVEKSVEDLIHHTPLDSDVLTAAVRALKADNQGELAARLALAKWPSIAEPVSIAALQIETYVEHSPAVNIRIEGTALTNFLATEMRNAFACKGRNVHVDAGEFGQSIRYFMEDDGVGYDAVFVQLDLAALAEPDWREFKEAEIGNKIEERIEQFLDSLARFANRASIPVIANTFPAPSQPVFGNIDIGHQLGLARITAWANARLAEVAHTSGLIVFDVNVALSEVPPSQWTDPKFWFYGRAPFSPMASRHLAAGFVDVWSAATKGPAKVLALDLDNTLWGGVFGDDGVNGLALGDDYPGNAFKAMQNECLRLKNQGFLLVILSKNEPDAWDVFDAHPGAVLGKKDFVATRINWAPKPDNIREIAEELNLGLDAFVFIDDSPQERAAMRLQLPQVVVPEMPEDVARRPGWLRGLPELRIGQLTAEDARRSDMYIADKDRISLKNTTESYETYLASLEQRLIVRNVDEKLVPRVAQMHMRTNQFNLTTVRHDERAIRDRISDGQFMVVAGEVSDKFGDQGLAIAAVVECRGDEAEIDSFLMSCRVAGRGVEYAFLSAILTRLEKRGVQTVFGTYIPTPRNNMVSGFYENAGFSPHKCTSNLEHWRWNFGGSNLYYSNIKLVIDDE